MKNDQDKNIISAGNAGKMETTGVKTLLGDPKKAIVKLVNSDDCCHVRADNIQPN